MVMVTAIKLGVMGRAIKWNGCGTSGLGLIKCSGVSMIDQSATESSVIMHRSALMMYHNIGSSAITAHKKDVT
jgi:hypothetical protein